MATTAAPYLLPFPIGANAPNVPADIQALADRLHALLAGDLTIGDDLTVTGDLVLGDWTVTHAASGLHFTDGAIDFTLKPSGDIEFTGGPFAGRLLSDHIGITGAVNADGTENIASGAYSVVRNSTGDYTVTFTTAMPVKPHVSIAVVSPIIFADHWRLTGGADWTTGKFRVQFADTAGAAYDPPVWTFHAKAILS